MRRWVLLLVVGSLAILALGAVRIFTSGGTTLGAALGQLRNSHPYYVGRIFESLPISRIDRQDDVVTFYYGSCKRRCVQVQQRPLEGHNPVAYLKTTKSLPCTRTMLRGVPAARFEGLEVYTGDRTVSLFARTPGEELRMAAALRRLGERTPRRLPPPARDLTRGLAACAKHA
jgi:hypothetical protein